MSIKYKKGIGYAENSKALIIDLEGVPDGPKSPAEDFKPAPVDTTQNGSAKIARWGHDNLFPEQLYKDIDVCGILEGIIDGKARFAICNGILPALVHYDNKGVMVIDEIVTDPEIVTFLQDNNHFFASFGWMKDLCGIGNAVARFMLSKDRKSIAAFRRDDVTEMRYEEMNDDGVSKNLYLSACWSKVGTNVDDSRVKKVALLNEQNPLKDLRERLESDTTTNEFAMTFKYPSWGRKYYSLPLWYAAYKWVKIAIGVPEMKAAMFENNFRPKYLVIISDEYWDRAYPGDDNDENVKSWADYTEKEKQDLKTQVYEDIDKYLTGNKNAYKAVFCDGVMDPTTGKLNPLIDIRPIDDTTKAGELLPDSAAANSEIAFSMLFNPAIIGASMPSGPYTNSQGGSNVRESALLQVIIHELERRMVQQVFNVIKRFNGWDKAAFVKPGTMLEFIIPATIPTTLDTGSNVKPMITGVSPTNQTQPNGAN